MSEKKPEQTGIFDHLGFLDRLACVLRLVKQRYGEISLQRTFNKFMGSYPELASKFSKSPSSMICDSVPKVQLYTLFVYLMFNFTEQNKRSMQPFLQFNHCNT